MADNNGLDVSYLPPGMQWAINIGLAIATIIASLWGFSRKKNKEEKEGETGSRKGTIVELLTSIKESNQKIEEMLHARFQQDEVERRAQEIAQKEIDRQRANSERYLIDRPRKSRETDE